MRTQYQLHSEITRLGHRQKDIEFGLKNPHKHPDDSEWVAFIAEIKAEYLTNAERIGYLQSQLKLLKLEAAE
jgi:hypothetical protein